MGGECIRRCVDGAVDITPEVAGCEYLCVPTPEPTETCDLVDNDCDGRIDAEDDDYSSPGCGVTLGVCADANRPCTDGVLEACTDTDYAEQAVDGPFEPGDETTCDGHDNNCDGVIDELCCAVDEAEREAITPVGRWMVAGATGSDGAWTLHAVNLTEGDDRGRWMSWTAGPRSSARGVLDGGWDLCAAGAQVSAAAYEPSSDALVVACTATAGGSSLVLATRGGQTRVELASLPDVAARLDIARQGDRLLVAAQYTGRAEAAAGAALVMSQTDGAGAEVRALTSALGGVAQVDVVGSGQGFWVAAVVPDAATIAVEQITASLTAAATTTIAAGAVSARSSVASFAFDDGDAALVWCDPDTGTLRRSLVRRNGSTVSVIDRGSEVVEPSDGTILRVAGAERTVALSNDGFTSVFVMSPGYDAVESAWRVPWERGAGDADVAVIGEGIRAWFAPLGEGAGTAQLDGLGLWRLGSDAAAICP